VGKGGVHQCAEPGRKGAYDSGGGVPVPVPACIDGPRGGPDWGVRFTVTLLYPK